MSAIVGWQIDSVGFVIAGDDDAAAIQHAIFAQVFFINSQHVGRGGNVGLHVIVELISVDIAQVSRFAHAQNDRLEL